ncbi:iron chelate uptake ABC transporter family permease subunit (plasmid) [Cereibacter azotoformans]|uniref:iron chelate uptake ABC transporter family permease subunit n=1 Tax=Cereibacter azotoformans TaxID=43057 RepID=UPI0002D29027|nr:iron chelate uptake ABC transporter family permease subunit [Cereibacter azotoformans]ULB12617.1 iron chelate uptake ABC transporter family permease subunit [Cereibacter azotoformans]
MILRLMLLALVALMLASLVVGAAGLGPAALLADPQAGLLLAVSRVPRTAAVVLSGAALAVAGVVMQQVARNRFVEPGTTGTAEGAALGLLAVTLLAPGAPVWIKMAAASGAALAGAALFLALIRRLPPREVLLVPIVGLVLAGVLQSVASFIAWKADMMQLIGIWLMSGEFSGVIAGRYELLWIAGAAAALAWFAADRFAILGLGERTATGLGLNAAAVMRLGLGVVSLVTAMVVVTVGMVPFVGLVVPNLVSRVMGDDLRASLPVVAAAGGALVLACDLVGRLVRHPYEVPAGTVLGVLGSLLFLWLLWRPVRG